MIANFTITGNPLVKKNSRSVVRNRRTGRMFPIKSKALREGEKAAIMELATQRRNFAGLKYTSPIHVKFVFYRATKHRVDLSNLYEFAQDVLQSAGIIADDFLIESHDGSRRMYDAKNPRTEIFISPFDA